MSTIAVKKFTKQLNACQVQPAELSAVTGAVALWEWLNAVAADMVVLYGALPLTPRTQTSIPAPDTQPSLPHSASQPVIPSSKLSTPGKASQPSSLRSISSPHSRPASSSQPVSPRSTSQPRSRPKSQPTTPRELVGAVGLVTLKDLRELMSYKNPPAVVVAAAGAAYFLLSPGPKANAGWKEYKELMTPPARLLDSLAAADVAAISRKRIGKAAELMEGCLLENARCPAVVGLGKWVTEVIAHNGNATSDRSNGGGTDRPAEAAGSGGLPLSQSATKATKAPLDADTAAAQCPPQLQTFLDCLSCHTKTDAAKATRAKLWRQWDPNGNGFLSLSEVDKAIKDELAAFTKEDAALGESVWKRFRPSYIRAFNDAKDVNSGNAQGDDSVTAVEFRMLLTYLRLYATWFEVFSLVDGLSDGTTASDDRRIGAEEWNAGLGAVLAAGQSWAPFVRFQNASKEDFGQIDGDGGGKVLLAEWCKWVEAGEIEGQTEWAEVLAAGE